MRFALRHTADIQRKIIETFGDVDQRTLTALQSPAETLEIFLAATAFCERNSLSGYAKQVTDILLQYKDRDRFKGECNRTLKRTHHIDFE